MHQSDVPLIKIVKPNRESVSKDIAAVLECSLETVSTAEVRNKKDCVFG